LEKNIAKDLKGMLGVCSGGDRDVELDLKSFPGIERVPWKWAREKETAEFAGDKLSKLRYDRVKGCGYPYAKDGTTKNAPVSYFLPLVHAIKITRLQATC